MFSMNYATRRLSATASMQSVRAPEGRCRRTLNVLSILVLLTSLTTPATAVTSQQTLTLDDAKHLLFRTGFGATADELNTFVGQTREQSVELVVNGFRHAPQLPMPSWTQRPAPHHWARGNMTKSEKRNFNEARDREIASLRVWWVRQMIETNSPQTERLVLMWHNHFATAYAGINAQAISIARQHQLFREYGTGDLADLLKQMIRDPALLNYLDNEKSHKKSPNENLARELMELFTLGEGHFTESDVRNAARALTGYGIEPIHNLQFRFRKPYHDTAGKTLFGKTGNYNGDDLIDLILQQPHTATFIAKRFWQTYISDLPAEAEPLQQLATDFRDSGYNLKTLYRATLLSDAFWQQKHRATIVRSPVALVIGAIRSSGIVPTHWQTLPATLASMGQNLFDPPNVAGWPGGAHWITPSRLLNRMDWLEGLALNCSGTDCTDTTDSSATRTKPAPANTMNNTAAMSANSMAANVMSIVTIADQQSTMPTADSVTPSGSRTGKLISIRLAGEDFDEPVQYQVSIHLADKLLWTTGPTAVAGGHDSERLGRMKLDQAIPWQVVEFNVAADIKNFDRISVEFLNDAANNGTDRNLFVDNVVYNSEHFPASTGTQESACPPSQPYDAGRLYCNGTLTLLRSTEKPVDTNTSQAMADHQHNTANTIASNRFTAGAVYLRAARSAKKKSGYINFGLTNVWLNGRYWHTVNARFSQIAQTGKNSKEKGNSATAGSTVYALQLDSFSCWPDCTHNWPPCTSIAKRDTSSRSLTFPLSDETGNGACQYQSLAPSDRALVSTLWFNIDQLYKLALQRVPPAKEQRLRHAKDWSAHIEKMAIEIRESQYLEDSDEPIPLLQLAGTTENVSVMQDKLIHGTPLPGGRSVQQREQDWRQLLASTPQASLQTVLLPTAPVTNRHRLTLQEVLTDLSAQLQ